MMRINDNRELTMQPFSSIHHIGDIFEYASEIYMTIIEVSDYDASYYNAVCLKDGELHHFDNEQVQVLKNVTLEIY